MEAYDQRTGESMRVCTQERGDTARRGWQAGFRMMAIGRHSRQHCVGYTADSGPSSNAYATACSNDILSPSAHAASPTPRRQNRTTSSIVNR